MHSRAHLRTLQQLIGGVALWLLTASSVDAAPGLLRAREPPPCDAQTTAALKKLLRHPKSYGGPLATRPRSSRLGLRFDLEAHIKRAKRTITSNDAAAIQNDAPAARVDANDGPLAALRSLGFLVGLVDSHPRTRSFSPRSPRGPPASL
jgi:hypothetical protein